MEKENRTLSMLLELAEHGSDVYETLRELPTKELITYARQFLKQPASAGSIVTIAATRHRLSNDEELQTLAAKIIENTVDVAKKTPEEILLLIGALIIAEDLKRAEAFKVDKLRQK